MFFKKRPGINPLSSKRLKMKERRRLKMKELRRLRFF